MKAIVFVDGKSQKLNLHADNNQSATLILGQLIESGYISGFLLPLNKEDDNE